MMGDASGPRPCASRRATACLALSASIAIAGCERPVQGPTAKDEFSVRAISDTGLFILVDERTSCEYIANYRGGITLRSDGFGNVTPNCAGSHDYARGFPYGERPDQLEVDCSQPGMKPAWLRCK